MNTKDEVSIRRSDRASSEIDLLEQLHTLRKPISGDVPIANIINPMVRQGELFRSANIQVRNHQSFSTICFRF